MVAEPDRYHNAILINLHGELLPMPPARNFSDAAKAPRTRAGWRAVAHPERLRPRRTAGNDALSDAPRFRVYAWKAEFHDTEVVMTQEEPFLDANASGTWDTGESYQDWNGNGVRDTGLPLSVVIPDGDFSQAPNDATTPSIRVRCLAGGVDADGDATADVYRDWANAPLFPEAFTDVNGDGHRQIAEAYLDLDGNGTRDALDPHAELDGDGTYSSVTESLTDANGNGRWDAARPAEPFTDTNGNGSLGCRGALLGPGRKRRLDAADHARPPCAALEPRRLRERRGGDRCTSPPTASPSWTSTATTSGTPPSPSSTPTATACTTAASTGARCGSRSPTRPRRREPYSFCTVRRSRRRT